MKTKANEKKVKLTEYNLLQDRLTKKVNPLFATARAKKISYQLKSGTNKYLKHDRVENTTFDPRWIEKIEDCMPELDQIIRNPKKVTETVTDVVPIELARKTNAESVKHLTTHSQYVKDIDEKGNVVPNKILNIGADDFYATYENRFIATLIRKLVLFVEKRYQYMVSCTQMKETQILYFKNNSMVDGKRVEIETKIKVTKEEDFTGDNKRISEEYIHRVEEMRTYLYYYYNSDLMNKLKTEKNVRNPIIMTNILRKNKAYNKAYLLYKFIDHYDLMGIDVKVDDTYSNLNEEQLNEINNALLMNFLTLRGKETTPLKVKNKNYKPKILTSIDDEAFVYGEQIKGPFSFVRIDDTYLEYLSKTKYVLPDHPNKKEREYFKEEFDANREINSDIRELNALTARKKKQATIDNKYFEKVVIEREKEVIEEARRKEEARRNAKLSEIEAARQLLIGSASIEDEESFASEDNLVIEEDIGVEENPVELETPNIKTIEEVNTTKEETEDIFQPKENKTTYKQDISLIGDDFVADKNIDLSFLDEIYEEKEETNEVVESKKEDNVKQFLIDKAVEEKPAIIEETPTILEEEEIVNEVEHQLPKKEETEEENTPRDKIPGRFIVKTFEGYYVDKNKYSQEKKDAKIFLDFNLANDIKKEKGGKVVKLS